MVWYEILLLALVAASIVAVFVVYMRHLPKIAAINVREMSDEKQRQVKAIMAEQRLARKLRKYIRQGLSVFKPVASLLKTVTSSWKAKIQDIEERYKIERMNVKSVTERGQESLQQKIAQLLKKAEGYAHATEYAQAEEVYISIIKLDPQSIDAYEGLGEVYAEQKKYNESLEVYGYMLKLLQDTDIAQQHLSALLELKDDDSSEVSAVIRATKARITFEMAMINKELEFFDTAVNLLQDVLSLEESNPKYLDALLDISIIKKDKKLANEVFLKLKTVNPENKKINDFEEQIAALK
ncbi:MAG: tetratricopeptide repeat protein [Patescibacteria group bacterium]